MDSNQKKIPDFYKPISIYPLLPKRHLYINIMTQLLQDFEVKPTTNQHERLLPRILTRHPGKPQSWTIEIKN